MKYMLDTNIIVYARNNRPEQYLKRLREMDPTDLCISAITLAELEYGASKSSKPDQNRLALALFLAPITKLHFDEAAAKEYGEIRALLERQGQPIGANDLLIAAHAKSAGLILVTNNTREFGRVPGLQTEEWT